MEISAAVAGQSQAAQIDEAAQIIGQLPQIQGHGGRELVGRAAAVNAEEIGLALETIDHGALLGLMEGRDDRQRIVPGNLPAMVDGHQVAGFQPGLPRQSGGGSLGRSGRRVDRANGQEDLP